MTIRRSTPPEAIRDARVLVVEAEPLIRMATEAALLAAGCRVVAARAEQEALAAIIEPRPPDAALVDLHLGWGTGPWRLVERLGAAGVPFAYTTAHDPAALPPEVRARPILPKPFADAALWAAVAALVGGRDGAAAAAAAAPAAVAAPAARAPLVLVVEDEPVVRVAAAALLAGAGCAVADASGVAEAVAALDAGPPPDAALVDVRLARGEWAWPVVARLRAWGTPVALVTGFAPDALPAAAEARGLPVLAKPYGDRALLATVAGLIAAARPAVPPPAARPGGQTAATPPPR